MKKYYVLFIMSVLLIASITTLAACGKGDAGNSSSDISWPAMDALNEIKAEDVTSIEYARLTEGGAGTESTDDATQMEDIILRLKEVKIKVISLLL